MLNLWTDKSSRLPMAGLTLVWLLGWAGLLFGCVGCSPRPAVERSPAPPSFDLVAYGVESDGALHAYTLDSGLTVDDCARALALPSFYEPPESMRLLTCEKESSR